MKDFFLFNQEVLFNPFCSMSKKTQEGHHKATKMLLPKQTGNGPKQIVKKAESRVGLWELGFFV